MKETMALEIFGRAKAVLKNNHFVYTSGRHGDQYLNKDALYLYPQAVSQLCLALAEHFKDENVEVVVAPAIGGVILTTWVAYHLSITHCRDILSTYAERDEVSVGKAEGHNVALSVWGKTAHIHEGEELVIRRPAFVIKRGYGEIIKGKRVLVLEDVLTTGGSVRKVVEATRAARGEVVGVGALVNRGNITAKDLGDVPRLEALVNITLDSWLEDECPLCKEGVPVNTEVGKGRDFLARKALPG